MQKQQCKFTIRNENGISYIFSKEILNITHVNFFKNFFKSFRKNWGRERSEVTELKSLTDWHVDSDENDKSTVAEHCALRWEREEPRNRPSSMAARPAPFIYLTPSSSTRTSVSDALTHSMPETIALVWSFTWRGNIIRPVALPLAVTIAHAALSSVSSERTFGFAQRVAALHLKIEQRRRARVLRPSVSFRLVTFIDRILANFVKSGATLISLFVVNKKLLWHFRHHVSTSDARLLMQLWCVFLPSRYKKIIVLFNQDVIKNWEKFGIKRIYMS